MDILQPLPFKKWHLLQDSLKRDWPKHSYHYYLINNSIKWKNKDPQFEIQFYCPNGDMNSGVLEETALINWKEFVLLPGVSTHFEDVVEDFIKEQNCDVQKILSRLIKMVPEECEIRNLDESHIQFIHSVWPHRSETESEKTIEFLASMVRLNRGVGLFLKKDGSLVSWILHFDWGGLGTLQTLEEHKKKGYGKVVTKAIIKQLAEEENLDSFGFIVNTNVASQKLFESLGYKNLQVTTLYDIEPKSKND